MVDSIQRRNGQGQKGSVELHSRSLDLFCLLKMSLTWICKDGTFKYGSEVFKFNGCDLSCEEGELSGSGSWTGTRLTWWSNSRNHIDFGYDPQTKTYTHDGLASWKVEGSLIASKESPLQTPLDTSSTAGSNKGNWAQHTCQVVGSVPSPVLVLLAMLPYIKGFIHSPSHEADSEDAERQKVCGGENLCKGALWNEGSAALICSDCSKMGCLVCTERISSSTNQAQTCKNCNFISGTSLIERSQCSDGKQKETVLGVESLVDLLRIKHSSVTLASPALETDVAR